jgi:NDP-sugar pyrophosphorylase family protein
MRDELAKMDVLILCGGLGTRLREISPDVPKALMPFAGRPFIDILIESLLPYGFKRFVLCVGHLQEKIRDNFQARDYEIIFSEEKEPLGTGGALKNAASTISGTSFLVLNGDSMCPVDFFQFHAFHIKKGGIISLVLAQPQAGQDYGAIEVDDSQRVISFREKKECQKTMFVNGGVYLMKRDIFHHMPAEACFSLEYDFFPKVIAKGCYGFKTNAGVIDIGTPERYLQALQRFSPANQNNNQAC